MGVKGIWQTHASILAVLVFVNLMISMLGRAAWIGIGVALLLGAMALCYRQGLRIGHGACGIKSTVDRARAAGDKVYAQLDDTYLKQAWSPATGFRGLLASALIPYATGCIYIILSLTLTADQVIAPRAIAWLLSAPFWPVIMYWHEDFVTLTPAIAAMLLISPFVLPGCMLLGYMQGPRLWERTEQAMKDGRRRAKARARVGKTLAPKRQKPEI